LWDGRNFDSVGLNEERRMALLDDIPVVGAVLNGGNWTSGLAIGVGAVIILPPADPIIRPLATTAIKGGILAYQSAA
jgi:hypothetical protein